MGCGAHKKVLGKHKLACESLCSFSDEASMASYVLVGEVGGFGLSETLCYRSHIQIGLLPLESLVIKL